MLTPYPTSWAEPARIVLDKVRGGDVSNATAIHAAYELVGVALGKTLPDGPALATAPASDAESEAVLAELCAESSAGAGAHLAGFGFDWKKVLAIALDLLFKLLAE